MNSLPSHRLPLSFPGSFLGVSAETRVDPMAFYVRSLHRFADPRDLLRIGLAGQGNPLRADLRPEALRLIWDGGEIEIVFASADSIRLRSGAGSIMLSSPVTAHVIEGNRGGLRWRFPALGLSFRVEALSGRMKVSENGLCLENPEGTELRITEEHEGCQADPGLSFDETLAARAAEFAAWRARFDGLAPAADAPVLEELAWLFRSCQAGPRGHLQRRAVLMSKNCMTAIWSWDNVFNALALAHVDPPLAREQFRIFFDHQGGDGRLPDFMNVFDLNFGMTKPPVYGWALGKLRRMSPLFAEPGFLREVYGPMCRQARFWLETRDSDGDGLPEYHHGCDSGWDNGTGFIDSLPCASPDLGAWLILHLEELANVAEILNLSGEARHWRAEADRVEAGLRAACWDGERWRAVRAGDHRPSPEGDSLLPWLVGMAGHRLRPAERAAVVTALAEEGRFLSPWGSATESQRSPLYEADGYWRGPVWGPSTLMAVEAARACGAPALARDIGRRFRRMAREQGFAENHDAQTGRGLRDPAYTWTAAAWLWLSVLEMGAGEGDAP